MYVVHTQVVGSIQTQFPNQMRFCLGYFQVFDNHNNLKEKKMNTSHFNINQDYYKYVNKFKKSDATKKF